MSGSHRIQTKFMAAWSGRLVAVSTVCALGACAGTRSRAPDHVGTYTLESVDGRPLPADVDSQRLVSAEITLGADSGWTLTARSITQPASGARDTVVFRNQGRYTLQGQTLSLADQTPSSELATPGSPNAGDAHPGKGTLAGTTITSTEDGHVMVYRRVSMSP